MARGSLHHQKDGCFSVQVCEYTNTRPSTVSTWVCGFVLMLFSQESSSRKRPVAWQVQLAAAIGAAYCCVKVHSGSQFQLSAESKHTVQAPLEHLTQTVCAETFSDSDSFSDWSLKVLETERD